MIVVHVRRGFDTENSESISHRLPQRTHSNDPWIKRSVIDRLKNMYHERKTEANDKGVRHFKVWT